MSARRILAIATTGAVVAGGAGVAIASVSSKDDPRKAEQTVLDNAAKRLDVTPQKLRDALAAAQDDQLDEAVKNGDLTQKQADAIRQRRKQFGSVLGHGGKGPLLHRKHLGGPAFGLFSDLAKSLDLSAKELRSKLRDGKSIADVAKAQGKSLADVRSAVKAAAKTRTDKAVKDDDLTRKQADALLEHLDRRLENLDKLPRGPRHGRRDRFRGAPGRPDMKPGALAPAPPPGAPATLEGPQGIS